jgi:hypothetical protein
MGHVKKVFLYTTLVVTIALTTLVAQSEAFVHSLVTVFV